VSIAERKNQSARAMVWSVGLGRRRAGFLSERATSILSGGHTVHRACRGTTFALGPRWVRT